MPEQHVHEDFGAVDEAPLEKAAEEMTAGKEPEAENKGEEGTLIGDGFEGDCGNRAEKNVCEDQGLKEELSEIKDQLSSQKDSMAKMWTEVREMHKLYHNEFAGRLKAMQEELEDYHEIDRGRVFDDILREIARIYCDNAALLEADADEKIKKHIRYLFLDLEQLLESNGVLLQKSRPGDKRNHKFCQVVERVETDDSEKHDTVVRSKGTGFYTEKRPLIRELIDVYIYQPKISEGEEKA